jgi:hypothetical protein
MTLTVVWNEQGFHLMNDLPKGRKFKAGHHISHFLSPLPQTLAPYQDYPRRHFAIHADSAKRHCAKKATPLLDHNSLRRASHPSDSPDLVPSDFWLFTYPEGELQGSSFDEFDERDELLSGIQKMLRGVDSDTLDAAVQKWMIRLQKCIDGNDEYAE